MRPTRNHGLTDVERRKMCQGKVRYSDEPAAIAGGMISLETHGAENGITKLYRYRCPCCLGWHLTKKKHAQQEPITAPEAVIA